MNFNKGENATFYTNLVSDSEYLPLPSAFAKKYLEKSDKKKQTIVLQTTSSVEWRVKYMRIEDRYYFMCGWSKFMNGNSLQVGDFLVFWLRSHHPNPVFQVFIYSPNGCLQNPSSGSGKTYPAMLTNDHSSHDIVGLDDEEETNDNVLWRDINNRLYLYRLPLTKRFVKAIGINGYGNLRLENKEGKIWAVDVTKVGVNQAPHIGAGWLNFVKDNKVKVGKHCAIHHVHGNLLRVRVFKKRGRGRAANKKP